MRRYAAYLVVAAASVSIALLYAGSVVREVARAQTVRALTQTASLFSGLLVGPSGADSRSLFALAAVPTVRLSAIRSDGVVLGDSWADPATLENHGEREEVRKALAGGVGVSSRFSASVGQELLYVALPPIQNAGVSVVVRAASAVQGVRDALAGVYRNLAIAAAIILVVVTLLTSVVERRMIEPIASLESAAAAFARGELGHSLRVAYPPDLARVARAMNGMAAGLRDRIGQIEEQRNELEAIFSGMAEAVLVLDAGLRVRSVNAAARVLVGREAGEVEGRMLLDVLHNPELGELASEVLASGQAREVEITLRGAPGAGIGEEVHLQVRGSRLDRAPRGAAGGPGGVVLVLNDISRLKRLEEVRRDFVANVSHELKTPITAIKGSLETILEGAWEDPEASRRFLESAARHTERLHAIVNDLLSLSALERPVGGARTMEMERRELGEVARDAMQLFASLAGDKKITLRLEAPLPVRAWVHPRLMEQAIANLVDNAIKYSAAGSTVTVRVERREAFVALSVEDRGIGIPPADLPRVFERFYRVDKARNRDLGGTGLGLAIVKHIALVHGGSVEATSVPDVGSTFSVLIPASTGL